MTQPIMTVPRPRRTADRADDAASGTATNTTRGLLRCGVVAGPLFVGVSVIQALTRPGDRSFR